jgi:solute carrier family 25 carnitine/acylcarnitine transporter 20/29
MTKDVKGKNINPNSSALKNFLAGGVGGIALVFAGHPLDTIKVYHFTKICTCKLQSHT